MGRDPLSLAGWRVFWRTLISIFFLLSLLSCGRGLNPPVSDRGEFEVYFQRFEKYSADFGRPTVGDDSMRMTFAKLAENEAGRCEWNFFKGRRVLIDEEKWKGFDDGSREALVNHELGHCLLRRAHVEGTTHIPDLQANREEKKSETEEHDFVAPKSLMNPSALPSSIYLRNQAYYLKELFQTTP